MKPAYLRVFDGLRITTEHVDHLQGALHSAIQDIRGILGLGMVHQGMRAVAQPPGTILVEPGFAFDLQGNRIACDEPQTIEVNFPPAQNTLFLCAQYQQVPTDEVEGKPVQIWDSCSLLFRPDLPAEADNQIPLARIQKSSGNGTSFDLLDVYGPDEQPQPPVSAAPAAPATPAPPTASPAQPQPSQAPPPAMGVIELSGQFDDGMLAPAARANTSANGTIIVSEKTLPLSPDLRCASFHSTLTGRLKLPPSDSAATAQDVLIQVTSHAEVEAAPDPRARCICSIQVAAGQSNNQKIHFGSDAAEQAVLQLAFSHLQGAPEAGIDGELLNRLSKLMLRIELHRDNNGFKLISCCSRTDGLPSPGFSFDWTGHLLWKAVVY